MKKSTTSQPKQKRYSVMLDEAETLSTANYSDAQTEIASLQKELKPSITLFDHKEHKAIDFKKTPHQQNYRITQGNYVDPKTIDVVETAEELTK